MRRKLNRSLVVPSLVLAVAAALAPAALPAQEPCPETVPVDTGDSFGHGLPRVERGDLARALVHLTPPNLSEAKLEPGFRGQVIVEVLVDVEGRVEDARVVDGPDVLRALVTETIRQWRFDNSIPLPAVSHVCFSVHKVADRPQPSWSLDPHRSSIGIGFPKTTTGLPNQPPDVPHAILIGRIQPDGPADRAGIRKGDFIIALNGEPFEGADDFRERIQAPAVGVGIMVTVARGKERLDVLVTTTAAADLYPRLSQGSN